MTERIHVPQSRGLESHDGAAYVLRMTFQYEADLAGGKIGQYAAEFNPVLHVFATHGLGVLHPDSTDDGVVVVPTSTLLKQKDGSALVLDVPINPAAVQYAKLSEERLWALPGAVSAKPYVLPDDNGRWSVPADASISFNAYVQTATQHGQACRTRAGESLFLLSELLDKTGNEGWHEKEGGDMRAEWQITGDEPLVKGFVLIKHAELILQHNKTTHVMDASQLVVFSAGNPASEDEEAVVFHGDDRDPAKATRAAKTMQWLMSEVDHSLGVFFPQETAPLGTSKPAYLRRMHCPYYNTTAGMLWGSTYALRVPRAPAEGTYFTTAMRAALLRLDAAPEHLLVAVKAQQASPDVFVPSYLAVLQTYASMFTVYANTMVYLDDFTNEGGQTYLARPTADTPQPGPDSAKKTHVGRVRLVHRNDLVGATKDGQGASEVRSNVVDISEDYKIARLGQGDDCEGVAKEIYLQFWQFRRVDLAAETTATEAERALLEHFQHLSLTNVYTPMLVLAGVTNKKLDASVRRDMTDEEAMAHTYTALVPTQRLLERLVDASDEDERFAGTSEAIRTSQYAQQWRAHAQPWHADARVLICEGTARSSPLVLPVTTYHATKEAKQAAAKVAVARFNAQVQLMHDLPMNVVQLEIPNRRIDDADGRIEHDLIDASDFYKGNSAAYISAFRDTGILDLAFAWKDEDTGALTHGLHFNRFVAPAQWHDSVRLVPYNRLGPKQGAVADEVLNQLEPIPSIRRSAEAAKAATVPDSLAAVTRLFLESTDQSPSTASLLAHPDRLPGPPETIVMSVRAQDLTNDVASQIVRAVARNKAAFSGASVTAHYLSDAPVHGDETSLPPVIVYDVSLRLIRDV